MLEMIEPAPREKAFSPQLPAQFVIIFDAVTHSAQFIDVKGAHQRTSKPVESISQACAERDDYPPSWLAEAYPRGPHRSRVPNVCIAGDELHDLLGRRRPFLTGKRLLTNQSFRDIYRTHTLDVDQRLKITSLTFLFTDLRARPPL